MPATGTMTPMALPPRIRARRSPVLLGALALLVAGGALTVKLTRAGHDVGVQQSLAAVHSPGSGWRAGGSGLDFGWDEDTVEQSPAGVRTGTDPEMPERRYAVSWDVPVRAGQESQRCSQAADWLTTYAPRLPGKPDPARSSGTTNPSRQRLVERCQRDLQQDHPGTVSDTFAQWQPQRSYRGYGFTALLTFTGEPGARFLAVTALAQQLRS